MKHSIYTLFFTLLFFANQIAFTQEDFKTAKVVTSVFKALKKQNEKQFLKKLPIKADIAYLISIVRTKRPEEKIPTVDSILANFKIDASKNFEKVSKKGSALGLDWNAIVLKDVSYEANPDTKMDIERADISLLCSSHDKEFIITLHKVYKIRDTWCLMNRISLTLL